jgi:RNA polymerase sigma factor (sigma-70 family)
LERRSAIGWSIQPRLRRGLPLRSQSVRDDEAALAAMYERHHQALYRYCRSILRDDDEAQDALQSTLTKALAALRDEQRDFELRPWLFRIAHNEAISRLRRRREVADPDAVAAASTDSLAQTVEDRERLAHLRTDLDDLPARQRSALILRELNGLSHEEIAGVLDISARAVKQTIFEARVALQECAEGRAMMCAEVQRALSDADGRVLRGRRMRSHLRACRSCRQFKAALAQRPADLAALAPALPAAAGTALLAHLLPGAKAGLASGAGTATAAGGGLSATVATKAAIVVLATGTLAGTTTAVRSVVAPSHHRAPAPAHVAPAASSHTAPASAAAGHTTPRQRPAPEHAPGTKHEGKRAHKASPGRSHAAAGSSRGKSEAAPGHLKAAKTPAAPVKRVKPVKPAKPSKRAKPAKTHRPHPVHPSATGSANGAAPGKAQGAPPIVAPAKAQDTPASLAPGQLK